MHRSHRRVSIDDHLAFKQGLAPSPPTDENDQDAAFAAEHPTETRPARETKRVLRILDEIQQSGGAANE